MLNPKEALEILINGNKRFVHDRMEHPKRCPERRYNLTDKQNPFSVIITCSDSRIPPTIIFDQGLGDLFIIRLAGQVLTKEAIGSIEYAVEHLNVKLVMILGHNNCGAVKAAMSDYSNEGENLKSLLEYIKPSVETAKIEQPEVEKQLDCAIRHNILHGVDLLKKDNVLSKAITENRLEIVGAHYDLESGKVELV